MPTNKYICVHGHFYQPPRENAWLETIELQEGAQPFHDWNEKINFECYAPNAVARILDGKNRIKKIVNNYTQISFNFGPTLLSWMEEADPDSYKKIQEADRLSVERHNGHGNALAQVYGHLIMPLANERDKETQIRWGIADFEQRFKRKPEGMWLAETAVDTDTLEALVAHGIKFTILAPRQAKAYRQIGGEHWIPLGENIDPRKAYQCNLPSGKSIALFFYDGHVSKDVAFQKLLNSGERYAHRLTEVFDKNDDPQLSHIATDGESYGHHHRHGEMALAWGLDYLKKQGYELINYGAFLEKHPPQLEVQIHENSSWSCAHGIERWRSDCGCHTGGEAHWNQSWRQPLRELLDWLREQILPIFEKQGGKLAKDIWEARNDYISLILNKKRKNKEAFLQKHAKHKLSEEEQTKLLRLLEMQRHSMLMYTSCAWFFNEISGIETDQVLQYALRAMQYAGYLGEKKLRPIFEKRLAEIHSNVHENGAISYHEKVVPAKSNMNKVGMRFAASSLFNDYDQSAQFLHYWVDNEDFERVTAGVRRLAVGRTTLTSRLTLAKKYFSFAVIYLDQHNIIGSISLEKSRKDFDEDKKQIIQAFEASELGGLINLLNGFGEKYFSFKDLAKDEKRQILQKAVNRELPLVETAIKNYYKENYQLMVASEKNNIPVGEGWKNIVQFVINRELSHFFHNGKISASKIKELAREFNHWDIQLTDVENLRLAAGEKVFNELKKIPLTINHIHSLNEAIMALNKLGVKPELWKSQNLYYEIRNDLINNDWKNIEKDWKNAFLKLGGLLEFSEELLGETKA